MAPLRAPTAGCPAPPSVDPLYRPTPAPASAAPHLRTPPFGPSAIATGSTPGAPCSHPCAVLRHPARLQLPATPIPSVEDVVLKAVAGEPGIRRVYSITELLSLRPGAHGGPPSLPGPVLRPFRLVPTKAAPAGHASAAAVSPSDPRVRRFDAAQRRQVRHSALIVQKAASFGVRCLADELAVAHAGYRSRFTRRLRRKRRPPAPSREFFPRLLPGGDTHAAISAVARRACIPAHAVAAAVSCASSWRPRPLTHPPAKGTCPIPRPLDAAAISLLLAPPHMRSVLVDTATHGMDTMYAGPRLRAWRDNHPSAYAHADVIDGIIATHLRRGWMIDVTELYEADPMLPAIVAPFAVVPKKQPGKWRIILDGSFGIGTCVNDYIDPSPLGAPLMSTCDEFRESIVRLRAARPDATILIYTTDYSDAYKTIGVRVDDWWQLAQCWRGRVYWNIAAPFGLRSSGHYLCALSHSVCPTVEAICGYRPSVFVDDSALAAYAADMPFAAGTLDAVAAAVGLQPNADKRELAGPPATQATWVGWVWDTAAMTMSLPADKLTSLRTTVSLHATRRRINRRALESVLGAMYHASRGVRHVRAFMSECLALLRGCRGARHWIRLTPAARLDLALWRDFLEAFNGVSLLAPPPPSASLFTDACTSWGFGFYSPELGVYGCGAWPPELAGLHINILEQLIAVVAAYLVATLSSAPSALHVHIRCDNTSAVAAASTGRAAPGPAARIARAQAFFSALTGSLFTASHVQGSSNGVADGLSRGSLPPEVVHCRKLMVPPELLTAVALSERPWSALKPGSVTAPGGACTPPFAG